MSYQLNEASFLKDVEKHEMTIIRDGDFNRHIRFMRPGTSSMHFDLVTWKGVLCFTGDMGTFVFSRLEDMFQFFRTGKNDFNYNDKGLRINRGYWSEKLIAVSSSGRYVGSVEEFDGVEFKKVVMEYLIQWIRSHREVTSKEERRDLWESVISEVIDAESDSGGHRQQIAAHDFHHVINAKLEFYFQDFWDRSFQRYTVYFTWCCYAIAWGIEQYDKAQTEVPA